MVDRAVAAGVQVLVANGNTSEFYGLQAQEAERMVHVAAECVAGRVPLLGGVGRSVHEARALARTSVKAGAAALMVHQPPDPFVSPTPLVLAEIIRRTADRDLAWVGGLAEVWAPPLYAVGARGFTSGLIHVFPERSVALYNALEQSDYALAMRLIGEMLPFEELRAQENNGANVTVVKSALQWMGNDCGATRAPSAWPLSASQQQQLETLLSGWKA